MSKLSLGGPTAFTGFEVGIRRRLSILYKYCKPIKGIVARASLYRNLVKNGKNYF